MPKKIKYLIYIPLALLLACINAEEYKQNILDSHNQKLQDVRVKKIDITECLSDCHQDSGRLINQSLDSNILKIELSHWLNCATSVKNNIGGFEYKNGVLNLLVKNILTDFKIKENGDTSFYSEGEACNCYFKLKFELTGFTELPDSITINNRVVNNYLGILNMFEEIKLKDTID